MKILWLVGSILPQAAQACGLNSSTIGGGWLSGQLAALHGHDDLHLTVVCIAGQKSLTGTLDGVTYCLLPAAAELPAFLAAAGPDLVHIWGTEYAAAEAMQTAAAQAQIPVLVGLQGIMNRLAVHFADGLPEKLFHSHALWHAVDRYIPGELLENEQQKFNALAETEARVLRQAAYVTGRTAFDRAAVAELAPAARYFACNETLRPGFYTGTLWHPRSFGAAPVLFMSQGNYPIKNLHTMLRALPGVLQQFPRAELRIAGWPPLDKGPLLRPLTDGLFPYKTYCRRLAHELGVADHVHYTGPLDEAAMRQAYLDADVFILPSTCENSPNSLGEAMLLGLPCVVSNGGGTPEMLADGREGLCCGDPLNADALVAALCCLLQSPDGGAALGLAARTRALQTHDPAANAEALCGIYSQILAQSAP